MTHETHSKNPHAAVVVVPCYNEERRLDVGAFSSLLDDEALRLLFVNDGSTDGTLQRLQQLASQRSDRIDVLSLDPNRGKAEAVRAGLRQALRQGAPIVGYLDADLATPPSEVLRLLSTLRSRPADVVLGARVCLLGRRIERSTPRRFLGRLFATAASLALGQRLYDTQCGAKFFRRTPALEAALEKPFSSRWAFDVELLARLFSGNRRVPGLGIERVIEEPLLVWRDVPGSKLRAGGAVRAAFELLRIAAGTRRRSAQ